MQQWWNRGSLRALLVLGLQEGRAAEQLGAGMSSSWLGHRYLLWPSVPRCVNGDSTSTCPRGAVVTMVTVPVSSFKHQVKLDHVLC